LDRGRSIIWIAAVSSYPVPVDVKQLKQFLGFTEGLYATILNYKILNKLLWKGNTYKWTACQEAFAELKYRLVAPPILAYPDFKFPFLLYTYCTYAFDFAWEE